MNYRIKILSEMLFSRAESTPKAHIYSYSNPMNWLLSHLKCYRLLVFSAISLYILAWITLGLTPLFLGRIADILIETQSTSHLIEVTLSLILLIGIDGLSRLSSSLLIEVVAQRLVRDVRQELVMSLMDKSQGFFDQQRIANLVAITTEDVVQLATMINPGLLFATQIVFGLLIPVIYLLLVYSEIAIIPFIFVVVYLVTIAFYAKQLAPTMMNQRDTYGKISVQTEEVVTGIRNVKAGSHEQFEKDKFMRHTNNYRTVSKQIGLIEARYLPSFFYALAFGLILFHAMALYLQNIFSVGDVVTVASLVTTMRFSIFGPIMILSYVQMGFVSSQRILDLINTTITMNSNKDGYRELIGGTIKFENVSFGYGDKLCLQDISFQVSPGETLAILGQVGVGKTTLMKLINRTYDPGSGVISIDQVPLQEWDLKGLRTQIANVESNIFLFNATIAENIALSASSIDMKRIVDSAKQAGAHDFVENLPDGYNTVLDENATTLSGGERQRLALARALYANSPILLLDDSTSAVDSVTERQILEAIKLLSAKCTVVMITHRLPLIRLADNILILEQGRCVSFGDHSTLMTHSAQYQRIMATQEMFESGD